MAGDHDLDNPADNTEDADDRGTAGVSEAPDRDIDPADDNVD